jgi:hypothetical protein
MAIRRSDRARLARLAMPLVATKRNEVERRVEWRAGVEFCEHIEALLRLEGVDPETTCVVLRLREAEAQLAAIPDTPALKEADEAYLARLDTRWVDEEWKRGRHYRPPPREEKTFAGEVERLMGRYRTDIQNEDLTKASVMELYAWCLSRHGATIEEATADIARTAKNLKLLLDQLPDDATEEDIERALLAEEHQ